MEDFIWPTVQFTFAMLFGVGCYHKGREVGWVAGYARGRRDAAYAAIDPNPDIPGEPVSLDYREEIDSNRVRQYLR